MIPVIYYAHSMVTYGLEREENEIDLLQDYSPVASIWNPNRPYIENHKNPMMACLEVIQDPTITILAFSVNLLHFVSYGVFLEINCAKKRGLPLVMIRENKVIESRGKLKVLDKKRRDQKVKWARVL